MSPLDKLIRRAWLEGYAEGYAEGLEQGRREALEIARTEGPQGIVLRLLVDEFGALSEEQVGAVRAAGLEDLRRYVVRMERADSLRAVLGV